MYAKSLYLNRENLLPLGQMFSFPVGCLFVETDDAISRELIWSTNHVFKSTSILFTRILFRTDTPTALLIMNLSILQENHITWRHCKN